MIRLGARSGAEYLRAMSVSIKGVPPATSGDSSNGPTGPSDSLDPAVRTVSGWLNGLIGDAQRRAETILVVAAALLAWIFRFVQDDAFLTYILLQAFYPEDIVKGTQKDLDGIRLSLCGPGQDTPHDDRGQVLPGLEPFH